MGRALALTLAALALMGGCRSFSREFRISGTITIAPGLRAKAPQENAVLFIIAKSKGGVPIAVRRIVNPEFPVSFSLTAEDLLLPAAHPEPPFLLQVQMNSRGDVGAPVRGDLEGTLADPVYPGKRDVHILIDRQI